MLCVSLLFIHFCHCCFSFLFHCNLLLFICVTYMYPLYASKEVLILRINFVIVFVYLLLMNLAARCCTHSTLSLLVWVPDSGAILHKRANQRKVSSLLKLLWATLQGVMQKRKLGVSLGCHGLQYILSTPSRY